MRKCIQRGSPKPHFTVKKQEKRLECKFGHQEGYMDLKEEVIANLDQKINQFQDTDNEIKFEIVLCTHFFFSMCVTVCVCVFCVCVCLYELTFTKHKPK